MAQPQWITPAGSLGTWPEGEFYSRAIAALDPDGGTVYYRVIAGALPAGVQLNPLGFVEGTPRNLVDIRGVPREVSEDVISQFAIRAYTTRTVGNLTVVDRLADRTFTITVTGQDAPQWITASGQLLSVRDGSRAEFQLQFYDPDPDEDLTLTVVQGQLPPGLTLDRRTGLISGIVLPLTAPPGSPPPGFDATQYSQYAWDFSESAQSRDFGFTIALSDGTDNTLRAFTIYVTASGTEPPYVRPPLLLTPPGSIGVVRSDNFFAFQFQGIDYDGEPIEFVANAIAGVGYDSGGFSADGEPWDPGTYTLPPGLTLNATTGWLVGYIPSLNVSEVTYEFVVQVRVEGYDSVPDPNYISAPEFFTLTILSEVGTETQWLTPPDLGYIDNGSASRLAVAARNVQDVPLIYRLAPGRASRLPPGLTLLPSGNIVGTASFITFALDGGTTTFDVITSDRLGGQPTTFDQTSAFTVEAYAPSSETVSYEVTALVITSGGSGYDAMNPPQVLIEPPLPSEGSVQATAGAITIVGGVITAIAIGNPGRGYRSAPAVTIGGAGGATAQATLRGVETLYAITTLRRFTVQVRRAFNEPYQTLRMRALPSLEDRARIDQLLDPTGAGALIPLSSLYRPDDANFGIADSVIYPHALGLRAQDLETYLAAMELNHYWRDITLGGVRWAQALDESGEVVYEVIYSPVQDPLINQRGISVGLSVDLPDPVLQNSTEITVVYPNSLVNMRDRVISGVGQLTAALPLWMTSRQPDNTVLGFTPAWVLAYVLPGQGAEVVYRIQSGLTWQLNSIDFTSDRYELDRSQTCRWDPVQQRWTGASTTTFDLNSARLYPYPQLGPTVSGQATITQAISAGDVSEFVFDYATDSPEIYVWLNAQPQTYVDFTDSGPQGDYRIVPSIDTFRVIFQTAPDVIIGYYLGDGSTSVYSYLPVPGRELQVVVDQITQTLGLDYIVLGTDIIFYTVPQPAAVIEIQQLSVITVYQLSDVYVNNPNSDYGTITQFDGGTTRFNAAQPCEQGERSSDKYLLYPQRTIIG